MSTTLLYGLILGIGNILLTLLGYFLGYQTDKINEGGFFGFLTFILFVLVLWLGVRAVREEHPKKELGYGKGVGAGMLVALYGSLSWAIYIYLHFTFIHPNYADYAIPARLTEMTAQSAPPEVLEKAENAMRAGFKPVSQALIYLGFGLVCSLIVSLISAAFLKQAPAAETRG